MNLEYYYYRCESCGNKFKSPELGGNCYGEFLMRSETGSIAYLNSFKAPVFDEVSKIFNKNILIITRETNDIEKSDIFQKIFSVACDLAPDNTSYEISGNRICPYCGINNTDIWGEINPPEFIELEIKPITHNVWSKLSQAEKTSLVDQAIKKIIS